MNYVFVSHRQLAVQWSSYVELRIRVRQTYALLAKQYGVKWNGRKYDPKDWEKRRCCESLHQCCHIMSVRYF